MHVVAAFFASIVTFVSGLFGSPLLASNSPVDVPSTQTAAAAAPYATTDNPFLTSPTSTSPLASASSDTAVDTAPQPAAGGAPLAPSVAAPQSPPQAGVSPLVLATLLATFEQQINQKLAALPAAVSYAPAFSGGGAAAPSYAGTWGLSQRIDQLTNTTITTPTITSPAITGGSLTNVTVNGYLPTSGGTLTGALTGPYFTATDTAATSSFAGGFTAANNGFSILQNGNVGIGTTAPTAALTLVGDTNVSRSIEVHNEYANGLAMYTHSDQWFRGPSAALFKSRGTQANPTAVQAGDILGYYQFWGHNGTTYVNGPVMESVAAENWSNGAAGSHLDFYTVVNGTNGVHNFVMRLAQSGYVGIGTTTPWGKLSIKGSGTGTGLAFAVADSANTTRFVIQDNGNVGIGTTTPGALLSAQGNILGAGTLALTGTTGTTTIASGQGFTIGGSQFVVQQGSGNVGIGTTSPDMLLSVGSATPVGSVAHFENSTGSCYINPTTTSLSCSSDARLKTNVNTVASSTLDALLQLRPVTYNWKTESATSSPHTGFIAQEVQQIFPDLISQGPDGYYTLNYAGLTPYLTKAVQEIAAVTGTFKSNLIAWLADASNGIATIVAQAGHFTTVVFDRASGREICLTDSPDDAVPVCITKAQLAALLSANGGSQSINFVTSPPHEDDTSPQAPVITLNGNATSTIPLGALYLDLGARITAPAADTNLGLTTLLDGATTTAVSIDTSVPGTHEILYTVTDPAGLTGTAVRTVIVAPANAASSSPSNPFTTPANDNTAPATTTPAISVAA